MLSQHRDFLEELHEFLPGSNRPTLLDLTMYEIERLARSGPAHTAKFARVAIEIAKKRKIMIAEASHGPSDVDLSTVVYAATQPSKTMVATIDRGLTSMLNKNGISTIGLRRRHGLVASETRRSYAFLNNTQTRRQRRPK